MNAMPDFTADLERALKAEAKLIKAERRALLRAETKASASRSISDDKAIITRVAGLAVAG